MEAGATLLVLAGVVLQASAAWIIVALLRRLPHGSLRREWTLLLGFVIAFIVAYLAYLVVHPEHRNLADLGAPGIFFVGAAFVVLVARLMHRTALDLSRMSELETENVTDPLTGVHNRRAFDRHWASEAGRARRLGIPLSLLLLDVDRFKSINDTMGHDAGDRVLVALARLIRAELRETDLLARYGGEEFAVIASQTRPEAAARLAERIRAAAERGTRVALGGVVPFDITVSIGIAGCESAAAGSDDLFERADKALYAAKAAGRNRAVVAGDTDRAVSRAPAALS